MHPLLGRGFVADEDKLERDNRGAYVALQRRMEDILAQIRAGSSIAFPRILTLSDQGLFALGYYHQRAFDRGQAREAAERRRAGQLLTANDDPGDPITDLDTPPALN